MAVCSAPCYALTLSLFFMSCGAELPYPINYIGYNRPWNSPPIFPGQNLYSTFRAPAPPSFVPGAAGLIPAVPQPGWISPALTSLPNLPNPYWNPETGSNPGTGANSNSNPAQGQVNQFLNQLGSWNRNSTAGFAPRMLPVSFPTGFNYLPPGDPRNCLKANPNLKIMQVVPGIGWDNLRNVETGLVTSFSYFLCKVTYDGRYIIPDDTFAIPLKSSIVERNAQLYQNWDAWKSVTSRSINAGFDFYGLIGGRFSKEFQRIKSSQYADDAITTRIELRHRFYSVKQLPDFHLHPGFKARLLEIAAFMKSNNSENANFLAEMLVRDFGTHYMKSVDVGAVLIKEDNLKSTYMSRYTGNANSLKAAAGIDFFDLLKIKLDAGYASYNGHSEIDSYRQNLISSKLFSYGGPPYKLGMNVSEWENNLADNLVAIDRSGKPLYTAITSQSLQAELPNPVDVYELRKLVKGVTARYYAYNTHLGCTDRRAPNFDYQANSLAEGSCKDYSTNFTFGGIFQTCTSTGNQLCEDLRGKNPLTGDFTCPPGYRAILLVNGEASKPQTKENCYQRENCAFLGFFCSSHTECVPYQTTERAKYKTFWCAPSYTRHPNTGYLFGGLYSNDLNNPITRSQSCPSQYNPLNFGSHAKVCVSDDYELGGPFSLQFGGFFSCIAGNLLSLTQKQSRNSSSFLSSQSSWPMQCPPGFTQHLAMVERDCRVNFCVKAGSLLKPRDLEIVMPPFEPKPAITGNSTWPGPMFGGAFLPPGPAFNSGVYYGVPPPLGGIPWGGLTATSKPESDNPGAGEMLHCHPLNMLVVCVLAIAFLTVQY